MINLTQGFAAVAVVSSMGNKVIVHDCASVNFDSKLWGKTQKVYKAVAQYAGSGPTRLFLVTNPQGKRTLIAGDTSSIARILKTPSEFGFWGLPEDQQSRDALAKSIQLMHKVLMPALMPRFMNSSTGADISEISRDFLNEAGSLVPKEPINSLIEDFITTVIFKCLLGGEISKSETLLFRSSRKIDLLKSNQEYEAIFSRFIGRQCPLGLELYKTEKAESMNDGWAIEQLMSLVLAGAGTTSTFLIMALAHLARHPKMQSRIANEKKTETSAFTNAFLKETLRLTPPVLTISREALKGNFLEPFGISSGTEVILNLWPGLNDAEIFGADCDRFIPERWLQNKIESSSFLPFGSGPHICIGRHLAMMEAKILLQELCSMVNLSLAEDFSMPDIDQFGRICEIEAPLYLKLKIFDD